MDRETGFLPNGENEVLGRPLVVDAGTAFSSFTYPLFFSWPPPPFLFCLPPKLEYTSSKDE